MTPEREAEVRKIAGRDGESWRSSKVSSLALKETLAELDALRAKVGALKAYLYEERNAGSVLRLLSNIQGARSTESEIKVAVRALTNTIEKARGIGLFEVSDGE